MDQNLVCIFLSRMTYLNVLGSLSLFIGSCHLKIKEKCIEDISNLSDLRMLLEQKLHDNLPNGPTQTCGKISMIRLLVAFKKADEAAGNPFSRFSNDNSPQQSSFFELL